MFQIEREKAILESLKDGKVAKPKDLCELTGASDVTIRRDLRRLEKRGLIRRWHGCAQIAGGESAWFPAAGMASPEKERVARIAAQLVCDGDNIFLGAGTTCTALARFLRQHKNLSVMTPNLDAALELTRTSSVHVTILGGEVQVETNYIETLDEYTLAFLQRFYFDKTFITVNGIGLTTAIPFSSNSSCRYTITSWKAQRGFT